MIKSLREISESSCEYGTKAKNLSLLMKNNIWVPEGFALSAEVFNVLLVYNKCPYDVTQYGVKNKEMIAFIEKCRFPEQIENLLRRYYDYYGARGTISELIVRSSALCEDTEESSMAGMFESYSKIMSFEMLKTMILKCYQSLFSEKVINKLYENEQSMTSLQMGVVVQQFVRGELSGVAFTVDTIDMDSSVMTIGAVQGGCSHFVNGTKPVAQYWIERGGGIIDKNEPKGAPHLGLDTLKVMCHLFEHIEQIFDIYQDIEWTLVNHKLCILQARAITTYKEKAFHPIYKDDKSKTFRWRLLTEKCYTPLEEEILLVSKEHFAQGAVNQGKLNYDIFEAHNGYIYYREKDWAKEEHLDEDKLRTQCNLLMEEYIKEKKIVFQDVIVPEFEERIRQMEILHSHVDFASLYTYLTLAYEHLIDTRQKHWLSVQSECYIEEFKQYCKEQFGEITVDDFFCLIYQESILTKERIHVAEIAKEIESHEKLKVILQTTSNDKLAYERIAGELEGKAVINRIECYKERFKSIVTGSYPLSPVIAEKPYLVLERVRNLLGKHSESIRISIKEILEKKKRIKKSLLTRLDVKEQECFLINLQMAEKAYCTIDDHNYYIEMSGAGYLRLAIKHIAKVLVQKQILSNEQDIFYLRYDEICKVLQKERVDTELIEARKKQYVYNKQLFVPSYIGKRLEGEGIPYNNQEAEIKKKKVLTGISGLRKKVQGRIQVGIFSEITEPVILVLYSGHVGDLMDVINNVKGLIFEEGSPFDHMGIIARELNIPALYNVEDALDLLKPGDYVELDGIEGCVRLLS